MTFKFEDILRSTGHIYCPRPDDLAVPARTRHVAKLFLPDGEVKAICGADCRPDDGDRRIGCPSLFMDVNCADCIRLESIESAITKRSLMISLINSIIDTEQIFLDAMYWNFHNQDEELINPDPDGELAEGWEKFADQIKEMIERCRPMMSRHAGRFSWPTDLTEGNT